MCAQDMNPESAALLENGKAKKNWDKIRRSTSMISSQYLQNEDDPVHTGNPLLQHTLTTLKLVNF